MNVLLKLPIWIALVCATTLQPAAAQPVAKATQAAPVHLGVGIVRAVDAKARTLTISHQPMPTLKMAAMTMDFLVRTGLPLQGVKEGDTIAFVLGRGDKPDEAAIVSFQKVETAESRDAAKAGALTMDQCRETMKRRK